jgi:hypothetical protein
MKRCLFLFFVLATGCQRYIVIVGRSGATPEVRGVVFGSSGKRYIEPTLNQALTVCVSQDKECRLEYLKRGSK